MNEKNLQTVAIEEIWKSQSDGFLPVLLEIFNPDIKWEDNDVEQENCYFRVISDVNGVTYQGKKYMPCKFEFSLPEENGKSIGNASISISAIDTRIVQLLRSIDSECKVTLKAFFAKEAIKVEDGKEKTVIKFFPIDALKATLSSASYTRTVASFNIIFKDALQLNIPAEVVTKDKLYSITENG